MQTRRSGTLTRRSGRLTIDGMTVGAGATVVNGGVIHTWTTVSAGTVTGAGTWWARYDTSKPIGGVIDAQQIIVYWPFDRRFVLPVVYGGLLSLHKIIGDGGVT